MYHENVGVRWEYSNVTDGITVAEFHEWGKDDEIENIDVVPVVAIDTDSLRVVEQRQDKFPNSILQEALTYVSIRNMQNYDMDTDDYNIILSDGKRVIIVSIHLQNRKVNYYGRLIIRRERKVLRQLEGKEIPERNIAAELGEPPKEKKKVLSHLEYEHTIGLTQTERKLKKYLLHSLSRMEGTDKEGLIRYYYCGLFPEKKVPKNKSDKKMFDEMVEFAQFGWSDKHEEFGSELIGRDSVYSNDWNRLLAKRRDLDTIR